MASMGKSEILVCNNGETTGDDTFDLELSMVQSNPITRIANNQDVSKRYITTHAFSCAHTL